MGWVSDEMGTRGCEGDDSNGQTSTGKWTVPAYSSSSRRVFKNTTLVARKWSESCKKRFTYGPKQAPLLWNTEFTEHMKSIGYCTPHLKQMLAFSSNSSFTLTISFTFMPIARALMP